MKYLEKQLITYIGNKRKLLDFIEQPLTNITKTLGRNPIIFDGFAGSGVVSRMFKQHASKLYSNDLEPYSTIIGKCHLTNLSDVPVELGDAIAELNNNKKAGFKGIISKNYAPVDDDNVLPNERVFYTSSNASIIDTIRRDITNYDDKLFPFLVTPLLFKSSVHTNTSGVFKGFYKNTETGLGQFGGNGRNALSRITKEIELEYPVFSDRECEWEMLNGDTNEVCSSIGEIDIAYYDPPYNQHPYGSNYFMLNVILENKQPEVVSKVSGIPSDWKKSAYNKKLSAISAFDTLIENTNAKWIIVSYSDGGILSFSEMNDIFEKYGIVTTLDRQYDMFKARRPSTTIDAKKVTEKLFIIKKR